METAQKLIKLLSRKYKSRISVLTDNLNHKFSSVLDTKNGTMFSVSYNVLYVFKDSEDNLWSSTPTSFIHNDQKYHPKEGQEFTRKDGVKYIFTTKEEVLAKATTYFEKFIDINYGIKIVTKKILFYYHNKTEKLNINHHKFKARMFDKIDTYISFN